MNDELKSEALHRAMDGLLRELPVAAADDEALVTAVMARLPRRRPLWRLLPASNGMRFAAAAALILAVAGLALLFRPTETPIGQRIVTSEKSEELRFGDGAVRVTMYPGSEVLAAKRETGGWVLDLSQGEVFVNVVRKGTAFAVRTTVGEARALGTKYTVSLRQDKGGQEMNGLKSAVGAVMMVTVMAGTVEVIAQDQPAKVVGAGETVSVQAPKTALALTALSLDDLKKLLAEKQKAVTAAYKTVEDQDVQKKRAEIAEAGKAMNAAGAGAQGAEKKAEWDAARKAHNAAREAFNALYKEKCEAAGVPKLQEELMAMKGELQRRQPPVARPQGQGGQ